MIEKVKLIQGDLFCYRSNVKESSENQSRGSNRINEIRSPGGEPGLKSGELEQDDLYSTIEPNDILDLPRVRFVNYQRKSCLIFLID